MRGCQWAVKGCQFISGGCQELSVYLNEFQGDVSLYQFAVRGFQCISAGQHLADQPICLGNWQVKLRLCHGSLAMSPVSSLTG